MPETSQAQINNNAESARFESDFRSAYDQAARDSALDFALSHKSTPDVAPDPQKNDTSPEGTIPRAARSVVNDVSLGVLQSPRSVIRGVTKGANSMIQFAKEISDLVPMVTMLDQNGELSYPRVTTTGEGQSRLNTRINADRKKQGEPPVDITAAPQIPVIDPPKINTVTGAGIEAISQFLVGMKGVDKLLKVAGVGAAATNVGRAAQAVTKGAAADILAFDEHDQRLSNLIQQVPALKNPVTEYLQARPDDRFAEGKFKQAVEGLALGGLTEAVFGGVRAYKAGRAARAELESEGKTAEQVLSELPPEEKIGLGIKAGNFDYLGNAEDPNLFIRTPHPKDKIDQASTEVQGAFGTPKQVADGPAPPIPDYQINFARIEGPDDIKQLMDEMVNRPELKPSIEAARRGAQNTEQTMTAAQDIDGFQSLIDRRQGDAFNAEQVVAARQVYYDTTTKLMDAAKRAASPGASDIDVFNFRKMVAIHHAVQKEFMGVRAEAGRALQAWNIPLAGKPAQNLRAMENLLADFGGVDASKDLARKLASMPEISTDQINAITQGSALARTGRALQDVWTLGLLTNPVTHVKNLSSNALTAFTLGTERLAMAGFKGSPVTLREGMEFWVSLLESQKLAFKNAAQTFRTGESHFGGAKLETLPVRSSARDILDPEGKAGLASKALDWWGNVLEKTVGRGLLAADEYNKTILYQAQLRSLAVREGIAQGMDEAALKQHVADVLASPPEGLMADAEQFAKYGTFTRELGQAGQAFQKLVARVPGGKFIFPFIRTPGNIFKFTFERTPLAYLSSKVREDIAAGGVRRATALSRIGMGTSIMAMGVDMTLNGKITGSGPHDPQTRAALRRTGWQPYSIKIGDTYHSYAGLEPMATILGMSADMAEILSNYESYDVQAQDEADSLVTAGVIAAANQVVGKTFMQGFADVTEALSDPKRYGQGWINKMAGSFVPAGVAAVERAIDPNAKQVFNMMDAIRSRIPGFSDQVPPRRNIWGEEIKYFYPNEKDIVSSTADRLISLFNPVYTSQDKNSVVDKWILKNGFDIDMPDKTQVFDGVRIDLRDHPWIYDDLVRERGAGIKLLKYGNQTMKDFFTNLAIENDPYGRHIGFYMGIGRDVQDQKNFISTVVRDYTKAARDKVMNDHIRELASEIDEGKRSALRLNAVRPPMTQEQNNAQ